MNSLIRAMSFNCVANWVRLEDLLEMSYRQTTKFDSINYRYQSSHSLQSCPSLSTWIKILWWIWIWWCWVGFGILWDISYFPWATARLLSANLGICTMLVIIRKILPAKRKRALFWCHDKTEEIYCTKIWSGSYEITVGEKIWGLSGSQAACFLVYLQD